MDWLTAGGCKLIDPILSSFGPKKFTSLGVISIFQVGASQQSTSFGQARNVIDGPSAANAASISTVKFFGKVKPAELRLGLAGHTAVSWRIASPVRSSTAPSRSFQWGGGSSPAISLKSSKKTVFSPGMNSSVLALRSGC